MAAAENSSPAAPIKTKRRLNWDGPASDAVPDWTSDRTLREHCRILLEGGRSAQSLADDLGLTSVQSLLTRLKPPAARRSQAAAADPQPATPAEPAIPSITAIFGDAPPPVADSADWTAARDFISEDPDMAAEFIAAYGLTGNIEAFRFGFQRGLRRAQPAA